jgi:hypothetical protein
MRKALIFGSVASGSVSAFILGRKHHHKHHDAKAASQASSNSKSKHVHVHHHGALGHAHRVKVEAETAAKRNSGNDKGAGVSDYVHDSSMGSGAAASSSTSDYVSDAADSANTVETGKKVAYTSKVNKNVKAEAAVSAAEKLTVGKKNIYSQTPYNANPYPAAKAIDNSDADFLDDEDTGVENVDRVYQKKY